ncbi:hypothetical protein Asp14428_76960 [Actinoplanes sp. NBRC 14428]|uniref:Enoyl-CoA hydratase/carnithine racemase n=1 Tax=Pseudosporangium ferrugineum TaxID=439699 RepID=A0A2T0RXG6_9ACTN|nr:enoyl-CoA hydratase/isomerase family protein [Pseudosporangium ferrugineum]PRY25733.1 enoyl-CoA hydratase/carnithine racemase [Pseudosporangium ferrugineum]BCJ56221.1 hypothetical protein Asp14428_76960 [Actinoplanes sp. NBRC 14428]
MDGTPQAGPVRWVRDDDGVLTVTFDHPGRVGNRMNQGFHDGLSAVLDELERDGARGVVLTSAKRSFFSGDDVFEDEVPDEELARAYQLQRPIKANLRRLERLGVPVAAALVGSALGGGFEIALSTHHRVGLDAPHVVYGLPEVTWRILPACGGLVRSVRALGVTRAFTRVLAPGEHLSAATAAEIGLVDELAPTREAVLSAARRWVLGQERPYRQRWERPGYEIPGGLPEQTDADGLLRDVDPARLTLLSGPSADAVRTIYRVARESVRLDLDAALDLETEKFEALLAAARG